MKIFIETNRLILREIIPEDEAGLFQLDSDPKVHTFLGNKPIGHIEQTREIISVIRQQYIENGIGRWAIIEKNTNNLLGWAGLKLVTEMTNKHINYYDLGYRLIKKYWGQGYATEAAEASLWYAFEKLNLQEVFAIADRRNLESANVLKKAGLKFIEIFEYQNIDHNWYRINLQEWIKKKQNRNFSDNTSPGFL